MKRRSSFQCPKCGKDVGHVMRERAGCVYITQTCPCGWDDDLEPRYEIKRARATRQAAGHDS